MINPLDGEGERRRRRQPMGRAAAEGRGLARALSKLGYCSRSRAWELIRSGRVQVNGATCRDGMAVVDLARDRIEVDAEAVGKAEPIYLMLNKPRGLVTSAADEQGRDTVLSCLAGHGLPFLGPVGRLDKASEGLLLFTNDTHWAALLLDPQSQLEKTYHVQVSGLADSRLPQLVEQGVLSDGVFLRARRATVLRRGEKNSWLEIILDEGKNRHIRRLLGALGVEVVRLIRVAVGPLTLGGLGKGEFRPLTPEEVRVAANACRSKG